MEEVAALCPAKPFVLVVLFSQVIASFFVGLLELKKF
jgi:general stress protein CsbA